MEALLVQSLHKAALGELGRDQVLRLTYDQIREIACARHPELAWGHAAGPDGVAAENTELKRQKSKWVDRLGKAGASHASLLREIKVGRRSGEAAGEPSEFELTGLLDLMALARPTGYSSSDTEPSARWR